ncbi:MAG TPA: EAL domain-containing protein [Stellaceae bacterium]|nr:EAL domain-containing protein [Stellaceae bacterium]
MLADLSSLTARNDRRLIATSGAISVVVSAVMGLFALEGRWPQDDRDGIIVVCLVLTLVSTGLLYATYRRWLKREDNITCAFIGTNEQAVLVCDGGVVVAASAGFARLSGQAHDWAVGRSLSALVRDDAATDWLDGDDGAWRTRLWTAQRDRLTVELTRRPVVYHGRRLTAVLLRDLNPAIEGRAVAEDIPETMARAAVSRPHDPDAALEPALHQALARNEFTLVYQPQINIKNRAVTGFEALLRWQRNGMAMSPDRFIPIAERCGLIDRVGEWVLRQACATAAGWAQPYMIAVNVSAVQLSGGGVSALVAQILRETGLAASRLELEITETAMLDDPESALRELGALRTLGVRVAMDDFGIGFSSLSTLRAFPFDRIKIDKSFVQNVHGNRHAMAMLRGMLGLAHGLGLSVVAEGVETWEELDFLNTEHCAEAQGYLFAKPTGTDTLFDTEGQLKPEAVYLTMGRRETGSILELACA